MPVDETPIHEKIKLHDIAYWSHNVKDKIRTINDGTIEDPKHIRLSNTLSPELAVQAKAILREYSDVFASKY
jgi:hypothetical protein